MHLSPDELVFYQKGFVKLNATIVTTWGIILFLVLGAWLVTRRIVLRGKVPRWQTFLEIVVLGIQNQISDVGLVSARNYLGFLGTLFLFLVTSNALVMIPGVEPPTGSFSTTSTLAVLVFFAVPFYGIRENGFLGYFKGYFRPSVLLAPFHLISELSRTLALAIRLFGNIMSGSLVVAILLSVTPLFFPVVMTILGLIVGVVQAYIFTTLAAVFIAAAVQSHES